MAERSTESFKLTVVHTSDGHYLVNGYYKAADRPAADLPAVIDFMLKLAPVVLQAEPTYVGLSEPDQTMVESVRSLLVKRDQYWMDATAEAPNSSRDNVRAFRWSAS